MPGIQLRHVMQIQNQTLQQYIRANDPWTVFDQEEDDTDFLRFFCQDEHSNPQYLEADSCAVKSYLSKLQSEGKKAPRSLVDAFLALVKMRCRARVLQLKSYFSIEDPQVSVHTSITQGYGEVRRLVDHIGFEEFSEELKTKQLYRHKRKRQVYMQEHTAEVCFTLSDEVKASTFAWQSPTTQDKICESITFLDQSYVCRFVTSYSD